jgi:membrane protease YdiL (CAAX protease family)
VKLFRKVLFHLIFIFVSILLLLHKFPVISKLNKKVIDSVQFAQDSQLFSMYLNFDKAILALLIFYFFGFSLNKKIIYTELIKTTLSSLFFCVLTLLSIALYLKAVRWNPKFPPESLIFLVNNLLIVCIAEEAFFSRYILGHLKELLKFKNGDLIALLLSSIVFGLAHFKGGGQMIALSTVAGLFYGISYLRTGRLEASVMTHFGFNMTHFIFFSYPFLN